VPAQNVIESKDCKSIYEVPSVMQKEGLAARVLERLELNSEAMPDLSAWEKTVQKLVKPENKKLKIGIIGKYVSLSDAYISVTESIRHACAEFDHGLDLELILSDDLENFERASEFLSGLDAIVIPGGFGDRGIEGKLNAIRYARENKIPMLGLCLGLQCTVIEAARNLLGLKDANSIEFDENSSNPVIHLMEEQKDVQDMGATMRLGDYNCRLMEGTKAFELYQDRINADGFIKERHRHRYEFNNSYKEKLDQVGLMVAGTSPDGNLVEIVEYKDHPFLIACQFHPEFLSRPTKAHPLFLGLVQAAIKAPVLK
jgi:CTP synthase